MKMIKELDKNIKKSTIDSSKLSEHCQAVQEAGFEVVLKENSSLISFKRTIEETNVRLDFTATAPKAFTNSFFESFSDPENKEKAQKLKEKGENVFLHPFKFWIFGKSQTQVYFGYNGFGDCLLMSSFVVENQELADHGETVFMRKFKPFIPYLNQTIYNQNFIEYLEGLGLSRSLLEHTAKISEYHYLAQRLKWFENIRNFINS